MTKKTPSKIQNRKHGEKRKSNIGSTPGEKESIGLRIIGGTCRGRPLVYTGDNRVRPMKDRVREAVFNLIGPEVRDKFVIDLFAGTGALALEAVSRGAAATLMLEHHLPTAKNIQKNVTELGLEDRCEIRLTDTFFWTQTQIGNPNNHTTQTVMSAMGNRPWLVFCSPPYDFFVTRWNSMREMLTIWAAAAPPDSLVVVESDDRFDFGLLPFTVPDKRRRSYPPAEIGIAPVGMK